MEKTVPRRRPEIGEKVRTGERITDPDVAVNLIARSFANAGVAVPYKLSPRRPDAEGTFIGSQEVDGVIVCFVLHGPNDVAAYLRCEIKPVSAG